MTREGHISATGNGLVFEVRGHLTLHGLNGIGSASELGCLDAPQYLSAGSVQAFRHGEYSKQGIPVQTLAHGAAMRRQIQQQGHPGARAAGTDLGGEMITVNNCPFCRSDNIEIGEVGMAEFAVECQECRCIGPITGDIMLAISDWNEAPQPVQVES